LSSEEWALPVFTRQAADHPVRQDALSLLDFAAPRRIL